MICKMVDTNDHLAVQKLTVVNKISNQNLTVIENLRVLKQSIEEKEFAHDLDIVRQVRKISAAKRQLNSEKCLEKDINLGILQVINNVGDVLLKKSISDLSVVELSHFMMLVEKPTTVLKRDKLLPELIQIQENLNKNTVVKSLSLISVITKSNLEMKYDKDVLSLRKKEEISSDVNLPASLSLVSSINTLSIV